MYAINSQINIIIFENECVMQEPNKSQNIWHFLYTSIWDCMYLGLAQQIAYYIPSIVSAEEHWKVEFK